MKNNLLKCIGLLLLSSVFAFAQTGPVAVPNSGTKNIGALEWDETGCTNCSAQWTYERSHPVDFGGTADGTGNQLFNEMTAATCSGPTDTDCVSASFTVEGFNLIKIKVEYDDADVSAAFKVCFADINATLGRWCTEEQTSTNFDSNATLTTLETSFRHGKGLLFPNYGFRTARLVMTTPLGASPRVSAWWSR